MSHISGIYTLQELNEMDRPAFVAAVGVIFEKSPWVAESAWKKRPFPAIHSMFESMLEIVEQADEELQLALLRAHPDLGARLAMTEESTREQAGAGLDQLTKREFRYLDAMNRLYREKHGFPFIIAVKGRTKEAIMAFMRKRVAHSREAELKQALKEVGKIAGLRLDGLVQANGRLSTHVLDTASGRPASGMRVELWELEGDGMGAAADGIRQLKDIRLNEDGRCGEALLTGYLHTGTYELRFHAGDYFAGRDIGFLDVIPVRFTIKEPEAHYHVPLLVSPGGYSTYKGN
ncbi:MAG: decarboxylase [Paenibacillaceae bacterium]|jgi:2-oxo-4-hydroxy-4-carboxy-5-ureidoimidazoline decarboxylase|nr:decarboxylase [Paenibacillaceae bacterium]